MAKRQNSGFVTGFPCNSGMGLQCNHNGRTACCAPGSKCIQNPNCACPGCCPDGQVCNGCPASMVSGGKTVCADGNAGTPTPLGFPYPTNVVVYGQAIPRYGALQPFRWITRVISWVSFRAVGAVPLGNRRNVEDVWRASTGSFVDERNDEPEEEVFLQADADSNSPHSETHLDRHSHNLRHHQRHHHLHQRRHPRDLEARWPISTFSGTLTGQFSNNTTPTPFVGTAGSSAAQAYSTLHTTRTVTVTVTVSNATMISTPQPTATSSMAPGVPQPTAPLAKRCDLRRRKGQA
jgi:hypothetical protein